MAAGMKAWLGVVIGAMALVAISALPPSAIDAPQRERTPERLRYDELSREMRRTHDVLLARRWADSLSALVVRTAEDGLAVGLPASVRLEPAAAEWMARVRSAYDALETHDPRMVVGLFWQPMLFGAVPDTPTNLTNRLTVVGSRNGVPYCLQVLTYTTARDGFDTRWLNPSSRNGALGPCRIYAEHGIPGPRIQSWLEAGGIRFATRGSGEPPPSDLLADSAEATRLGLRWSSDAVIFGRRRHPLFDANTQVQACLAGRAQGCTRAVTDPGLLHPDIGDQAYVVAHSPVVGLGWYDLQGPFRIWNSTLLADLEDSFGADAFGRFWTSTRPVPQAFEAAFGVDMGEWLVTWVEPRIGLYRAGPGVPLGALPLSLVTFMALGAVTMLVQRRRTVS